MGNVIVIDVESRTSKTSSNSCLACCIHFHANNLGRDMNLSLFSFQQRAR